MHSWQGSAQWRKTRAAAARSAPSKIREEAVIRSTDRILVTHAGTLPRPADVTKALYAKAAGAKIDQDALSRNVRQTVADVVRKQAEVGIDSVNDGEISKAKFNLSPAIS